MRHCGGYPAISGEALLRSFPWQPVMSSNQHINTSTDKLLGLTEKFNRNFYFLYRRYYRNSATRDLNKYSSHVAGFSTQDSGWLIQVYGMDFM